MRRKENFEIVFFGESFAALSSFTFCFLSSPLLLLFFPTFFFFCGALTRLPFGGKKRSRIVNLFWRKYQWVVGQDFHWNFLVKVTRFFASFSGLFDWIALIWAWLERSRLPAQGSCQKLSRTVKTDDVTSGTRKWLKKGGYGRFRGQCVKGSFKHSLRAGLVSYSRKKFLAPWFFSSTCFAWWLTNRGFNPQVTQVNNSLSEPARRPSQTLGEDTNHEDHKGLLKKAGYWNHKGDFNHFIMMNQPLH